MRMRTRHSFAPHPPRSLAGIACMRVHSEVQHGYPPYENIDSSCKAVGSTREERVLVDDLGGGQYRLVCTPGWLQGLAAGDIIRLDSREPLGYSLVSRGGNIGVQCFFKNCDIGQVKKWALEQIEPLGGVMDGEYETEDFALLVFTFHVSIGFQDIEGIFRKLETMFLPSEWFYANVYDPDDGFTPLNWWIDC